MNKNVSYKENAMEEGLTVKEIIDYQKKVRPKHVYGKYGTLAHNYIKEHNREKLWTLEGDLPKYLHNIDKQAEKMYQTIYKKLSTSERYKKTGDYMHDLHIETEMQKIIEEKILNELVYIH